MISACFGVKEVQEYNYDGVRPISPTETASTPFQLSLVVVVACGYVVYLFTQISICKCNYNEVLDIKNTELS